MKTITKNRKLQNEDGPSIIFPNGTKIYFHEDKLHRIGGPAFMGHDGIMEYWVNNKQVTKEAHDLLYNLCKLRGLNSLINE